MKMKASMRLKAANQLVTLASTLLGVPKPKKRVTAKGPTSRSRGMDEREKIIRKMIRKNDPNVYHVGDNFYLVDLDDSSKYGSKVLYHVKHGKRSTDILSFVPMDDSKFKTPKDAVEFVRRQHRFFEGRDFADVNKGT